MSIRPWVGLCAVALAASARAAPNSSTLLKTSSTWDGAAIEYPRTVCPEVQAVVIDLQAKGATPVHFHPVNNYAYVLEGQVTVEEGDVADGQFVARKASTFKKGDAFAEVVRTWHRGTAGPDGVRILVWYTGEIGQPFTVTHAPGTRIDLEPRSGGPCVR